MTLLPQKQQLITLGPAASLQYVPDFINSATSRSLIEQWTGELDWVQSEITLFGRKVAIPRLNAWYGDQPYSYSGTKFDAKPFTRELRDIQQKIQDYSGL